MSQINDPEQNLRPGPAVVHNLSQANANITPGDASLENSGDFDDNATPLWSLYKEKSQIHDEAKIQILTKSMTDVLLFAGLFAAALSPFIVDRFQAIQVTPVQQMVFYEQQSVDLLKQISAQISSLSLQAPVPSPSPLPPLTANPSRSDILVNALLFISLVVSLSAALLATLVQRWARDHMQIFHRHKHPLKVSRIRQYLHEGVERWHMAMIAEAVPTLIHVSLFLFLVALAVFLSNANWTVAIFTTFFITLFFALYLIATILPVAKPQFPVRSPVSVLLWFVVQTISPRLHKDSGDGELKPVSRNMVDGLMELALEDKPVRTYGDRGAIAWLVRDLTRDAEVESFASIILGSFNLEWVVRVLGKTVPTNCNSTTGLTIDDDDTPHPLCKRIGRLLQTCSNPYLFKNEDKRLTRSRTCVQAVALLVFHLKADLSWFGDIETIGKLLKAQGYRGHPRSSVTTGSNQSLVANWTGLSVVFIQKKLVMKRSMVATQTNFQGFKPKSPNEVISRAQAIDNTLKVMWDRVEALDKDPRPHGDRTETEEDKHHREWIDRQVEQTARIFVPSSGFRTAVDRASYKLPEELPWNALKAITGSVDAFDFLLNPFEAQLKYLQSRFDRSDLSSWGPGAEPGAEQGTRPDVEQSSPITRLYRPAERQLWRLLDLHDGGAVGFTLELYLVSLREILSTFTSPSDDSHDTFFSAFEAITSDHDLSECTIWTQKLILELILDIAANRGVFSDFSYPKFIEEELVRILRSVVSGVHDVSYIGVAVEDLEKVKSRHRHAGFRESVLDVLRRHLLGPLAPPMVPGPSNTTPAPRPANPPTSDNSIFLAQFSLNHDI
ncbi:hypothetical protein BGW80DRAFT_1458133 [Lactifluus volemus]|nr:hypothetical protein BGW80DRAFT_1458133 [Lactifluus volemus]